MSDDLEGLGQGTWIGRLEVAVGELRLGGQAAAHNLIRGSPLQHALASSVVGLVEALEQRLQIPMAVDGDAEHLALHPAVEALHETVEALDETVIGYEICGAFSSGCSP
ncbi:hypothetical protein [Microvirga sp. Mcv34]|uniref:hypothetical protein n=1 Tax=Microvirga sp. Mcv34 TaxID=2926016 RepID=UPI0039672F4F